jgi:hypothetical protein
MVGSGRCVIGVPETLASGNFTVRPITVEDAVSEDV